MDDWGFRDTLGIVIVLGVTLAAAAAVDAIAQALIVLVGVVITLLWIARFCLEGYTDAVTSSGTR